MFFGVFNPDTGIIRKCLTGPDRDWAGLCARPGELVIESDSEIDNSSQMVNVNTYPYILINIAPPISPEIFQAEIVMVVQRKLDQFAQARGYDGILSACTYATSSVPQFQSEGQRAVDLRDQVWTRLYQLLGEVQSGTRPVPTSFVEVDQELPTLSWD